MFDHVSNRIPLCSERYHSQCTLPSQQQQSHAHSPHTASHCANVSNKIIIECGNVLLTPFHFVWDEDSQEKWMPHPLVN